MKKNHKIFKWLIIIAGLIAITLSVILLSLFIGSGSLSLSQVIDGLFSSKVSLERDIVVNIRLPRIVMGFAVGSALSLAGVILQGIFRNRLVEPYTLGVSGGAALFVSLGIVSGLIKHLGFFSYNIFGFFGAACVIFLLYLINARNRQIKIHDLLLSGVMFSFIASSLVMLLLSISRSHELQGIIFWIMGSLEEPRWIIINTVLLASFIGFILTSFFANDLNAVALGEEEARHLGVNVDRLKKMLFFIASFLTGVSVASAGIIGFVGLAVPHFIRLHLGSDHRIVIIASYIIGGAFLIFCDTLARIIASPIELPVGVITGILGGTMFVIALIKNKSKDAQY